MTPNLNKWKFIKLHRKKRVKNLGKGKKGKALVNYGLGVVLKKNNVINYSQFDAVKKFINKRLKAKEKNNRRKNVKQTMKKKVKLKVKEKTIVFRQNFNLGLTKKPLQVRMGKGKGSPVSWVYPYSKNRILFEFLIKKYKKKKLIRTFRKAEIKMSTDFKFRVNKIMTKKTKRISFVKKCIKEL